MSILNGREVKDNLEKIYEVYIDPKQTAIKALRNVQYKIEDELESAMEGLTYIGDDNKPTMIVVNLKKDIEAALKYVQNWKPRTHR